MLGALPEEMGRKQGPASCTDFAVRYDIINKVPYNWKFGERKVYKDRGLNTKKRRKNPKYLMQKHVLAEWEWKDEPNAPSWIFKKVTDLTMLQRQIKKVSEDEERRMAEAMRQRIHYTAFLHT